MSDKKRANHLPYYELGKVPPQAIDVEESILGHMIISVKEEEIAIYKKLLKPEMFYKEEHQKICAGIFEVYQEENWPTLIVLTHKLKEMEFLDEIGGPYYLSQLINKADEYNTKKYSMILIEKYILRELIRIMSEYIQNCFESKVDIFQILNDIKEELDRIEAITNISNVDARKAVKEAIGVINDIAEGRAIPFLKSDFPKFDYAYAINLNQIVVFAAQKGHLKTRTLVKIVRSWIRNNDNVAVLWYSMEEPASKMSRLAFCDATGIDDMRMLGKKKPKLTSEERRQIGETSEKISNDDIQYKEVGSSIESIKNNFISFCKRRPDKKNILVIDNYGRTKTGIPFKNSNEADDYISGKYVDIRDATGGLIFIVHHLTKEQLNKLNVNDGYRPREENVRGSSRIIDYANTLILGNFIPKHKDLIQIELDRNIDDLKITHEPFPQCYFDAISRINMTPDKDHKNSTDSQFKQGIINTLNHAFSPHNLKEKFPDYSIYDAAELIINRYNSYVTNMKFINKNRAVSYRSNIDDPLTYFFKGKYMTPFEISKETKEYYLYGNNMTTILPHIKQLLIFDGAKVRDGEGDDDTVLVRMKVHPGKMEYEEL